MVPSRCIFEGPCVSERSRNKPWFPDSQARSTGGSQTLTPTSGARPYSCSWTDKETLRTSSTNSPRAGLVQHRAALFRTSSHQWKPSSGKGGVIWCIPSARGSLCMAYPQPPFLEGSKEWKKMKNQLHIQIWALGWEESLETVSQGT